MLKKMNRVETLKQAQVWDEKAGRYRRAGFCDVCSAQAAWGHQIGFSQVQAVCDDDRGKPVPDRAGVQATRWSGSNVAA